MMSTLESSWVVQRVKLPRPLHCTPLPTVHFLSEIYTTASLHVPPCRIDAFGIDGNVFASDYKAPEDNIHIAVAQIHCANSDCSDDGNSKVKGAVSSIAAAAGEVVKDISKLALPDNEAAMLAKRVQLKQAAQKAQLTQLTYGQSDESNVYDPEHYSRPLEGHWVDVGSKGFKHWATGSEMVSKYGTDDPTKLLRKRSYRAPRGQESFSVRPYHLLPAVLCFLTTTYFFPTSASKGCVYEGIVYCIS
jgi:hypothetical protein